MAGYRSAGQARMFKRAEMRVARPPSPKPQTPGDTDDQTAGPKFGASHVLALAMAMLDLRIVHRATLRALLPDGVRSRHASTMEVKAERIRRGERPEKTENNTSTRFQYALYRFEKLDLITRGQDFVLVKNPRGLFDWAMSVEWPERVVINVGDAIAEIERSLRQDQSPAGVVEQRRQELIRLQALMEQGMGDRWSGRGSVRFVPRSRTL